MAAYGKGEMYVNFASDSGEGSRRASYPPENYGRLQAVKDQYDPLNIFPFNMNVLPTK